MIQDVMNKPLFNIMFSFLLGVGIIAIFRPMCKDENGKSVDCITKKAPPVSEWNDAVYRVGAKCYEYKTSIVECPKDKKDYIEAFQSDFVQRTSHLSAP
jgi:hypothetical protein